VVSDPSSWCFDEHDDVEDMVGARRKVRTTGVFACVGLNAQLLKVTRYYNK